MTTQSIGAALLSQLRALNISIAEVSYSGGNDDGGCDNVQITRTDGSTDHLDEAYVSTASGYERDRMNKVIPDGTRVTHQMVIVRDGTHHSYYEPATEQQIAAFDLVDALCKPVNDRYGSWAGEFSAHGRLTYDVASGTLEVDAYESQSVGVDW